ncbi:MAG: hypothetical protein GX444_09895 [Myxococcales bacterium]|nr:hypothetical protein [Myxococcales bacterium]
MRRVLCCCLIVTFCFLTLPAGPAAAAGEETPLLLAKSKGPILWQVEEEKQKAMENDMELLRLYNEAAAAKKLRKDIALGLFIPGVICVAGGLGGGLFQRNMSLYDEEAGELIMVSGVSVGLGLTAVAIYFGGFESQKEKDYKKYLKEKYNLAPIMQLVPTNGGVMARLGVEF